LLFNDELDKLELFENKRLNPGRLLFDPILLVGLRLSLDIKIGGVSRPADGVCG